MKKIYFQPESDDFKDELFSKVNNYFIENKLSVLANKRYKVKIFLMVLIYIIGYLSIFQFGNNHWFLFLIYGFIGGLSVLLGLNIGHDAAHNALFKNHKINKSLLYVFEVLGTNSYNWVNRHLGAHHIYPNIMDYDSDVQQTNVVKIFPKDKHMRIHEFQHFYMPIIYLFYIVRWILYRDFKDVFVQRIGVFDNTNYPKIQLIKMIIFKILYVVQMVVLPILVLDVSWYTILGAFFLLTIVGSGVIALVLLSTHVSEDAYFPEPDQNSFLPHSWSYHQVLTAADFATDNKFINTLFGGFNHHVIHHLFPNICHVHYPKLTPILTETAKKYNLPYRSQDSLLKAVYSHFKLLKNNSQNYEK